VCWPAQQDLQLLHYSTGCINTLQLSYMLAVGLLQLGSRGREQVKCTPSQECTKPGGGHVFMRGRTVRGMTSTGHGGHNSVCNAGF
jgi:hypothetical protein